MAFTVGKNVDRMQQKLQSWLIGQRQTCDLVIACHIVPGTPGLLMLTASYPTELFLSEQHQF
jgi:hypothetical protein